MRGMILSAVLFSAQVAGLASWVSADSYVVVPYGSQWRYQIVEGYAAWNPLVLMSYDDSSWPIGQAPFYQVDADTTIHCHRPGPGTSWPTGSPDAVVMRKWIDIPVGTTEVVMYYRGANNYMPHFDEIPGWNIYRDGCPYNEDYQVFHPSPGQHLVSMVAVNAYDASIHPWGVYADIQVVVTVSVVPVQKTTWGMIKSLY